MKISFFIIRLRHAFAQEEIISFFASRSSAWYQEYLLFWPRSTSAPGAGRTRRQQGQWSATARQLASSPASGDKIRRKPESRRKSCSTIGSGRWTTSLCFAWEPLPFSWKSPKILSHIIADFLHSCTYLCAKSFAKDCQRCDRKDCQGTVPCCRIGAGFITSY